MTKYRRKPIAPEDMIEAHQWGTDDNQPWPKDWLPAVRDFKLCEDRHGPYLLILTREGDRRANPGDWIIRDIRGDFYPCRPDIFTATYEAIE